MPLTLPSGRRFRLPARRIALAATAVLAVAVPTACAATFTTVATMPAESFSSSSPAIFAANDSAAEGGKMLAVYSGGTAQATVKLAAPASSVAILVRGAQCAGAPVLQLTIDGVKVTSWNVTSTTYTTMSVAKSLAAGTHTVALSLTNDYGTASCDRNLFVDTVRLLSSSTTTASATTPAPVPVAPAPAKLRWAPPALTAPTTIAVAQGDQSYTLSTTKDYILNLGATKHVGALAITGGHNVVIKGGVIAPSATTTKAVALGIKDNTGTVQVEGVWFDLSAHEMDAIQIVSPASTVQIENVRATGVHGTFATNHSDVIQPWGGVAKLRVDHLTADSNYQGIFTRPDQGAIGSVDLSNIDMSFDNAAATSSGGYLLWMSTDCSMAPTTLSNVYINPRAGTSVGTAVWPATNDGTCPSKLTGNTVTFPKLPVTGGVTGGTPPGGSFVPAASAGLAYTSPGYVS